MNKVDSFVQHMLDMGVQLECIIRIIGENLFLCTTGWFPAKKK